MENGNAAEPGGVYIEFVKYGAERLIELVA